MTRIGSTRNEASAKHKMNDVCGTALQGRPEITDGPGGPSYVEGSHDVSEMRTSPPHKEGAPVMSEEAASAQRLPIPPDIKPEKTLGPAQWGVVAFLISE